MTQEEVKKKCLENFITIFGDEGDIRTYFAPGRVNLIGEHTDYNGGHVFPCALTIGTYLAARKRADDKLRFYSENFTELGVIESDLADLKADPKAEWTNYPKGVMWAFLEKGYEIPCGFDFYLYGNIPNGSGLSSSASVEVVTGVMLKDMFGLPINMIDIAKIGQFSENEFNGVNCGIMDQFAIAMGKTDAAIYLDTADLSYEYAPIVLDGYKIVISCSNKKRGLGDSKYNERRSECEEALRRIQKEMQIHALGELSSRDLENIERLVADDILYRRAKHAVTENERTKLAVKALDESDLKEFGRLMNASHISLKEDYEVTGKELDTLVEEAWRIDGVIGSRMTGAGFGGCTVSIVKDDAVERFQEQVGKSYEDKIGYAADFYVVSVGCGACRI